MNERIEYFKNQLLTNQIITGYYIFFGKFNINRNNNVLFLAS